MPVVLERGARLVQGGGHALQLANGLGELQAGAPQVGGQRRQAGGEGGLLAAQVGELLPLARELGLHALLLVDGIVNTATGSDDGAGAAGRHDHHEGDQGQHRAGCGD